MPTEVTALGLPSTPVLKNRILTFPEQPHLIFVYLLTFPFLAAGGARSWQIARRIQPT